jgi:cystathionine gamma-lyase
MTYRPETVAILSDAETSDTRSNAVVTPIYQTTTFAQHELDGSPEYCYSRTGNPSRKALERALARLEGVEPDDDPELPNGGAFAFASGLAAANALLLTLSAGDHVLASQDLYGGCYRLFTKVFSRFGVRFSLVDAADVREVERAFTADTKLLWLESPSNPLLKITDIAACARLARSRGVRTVVDNTFLSPVFQRPLELGADVVLHSTTKYIGGHCDVLGGALITRDLELAESLKFIQNATGATPAPLDCFLLLRGLKTLGLRVRKQAESALEIARRLEGHRDVERVIHPGLQSHPGHLLASSQASGHGSVISVEIAGGAERVRRIVRELSLWTLAESLGGVKSLWCHPATMTHAAVEAAERRRIGISDGLIRLSVGLEHADDLFEDLDGALRRTRSSELGIEVDLAGAVGVHG